jgi:hypothetical protein
LGLQSTKTIFRHPELVEGSVLPHFHRVNQPQSLLAWIGSRILLSFLAALAGWGAGVILVLLLSSPYIFFAPRGGASPLDIAVIICGIMGIFVAVTWIFFLVPLSMLVPMQSGFWRPVASTLVGMAIGPLIMFLYAVWEQRGMVIHHSSASAAMEYYLLGCLTFGLPALIVGGVTGYVAAVLNRRALSPSRQSRGNAYPA